MGRTSSGRRMKRRSLRLVNRSSDVVSILGDLDLVEDADSRLRGILRPTGTDKQHDGRRRVARKKVRFDDEVTSSHADGDEALPSPPLGHVQSLTERLKESLAAEFGSPILMANVAPPQLSAKEAFLVNKANGSVTQGALDAALSLLELRCGQRQSISCLRPEPGPRRL